jgi:hypothetical protein
MAIGFIRHVMAEPNQRLKRIFGNPDLIKLPFHGRVNVLAKLFPCFIPFNPRIF